jgi:hypothetical protein
VIKEKKKLLNKMGLALCGIVIASWGSSAMAEKIGYPRVLLNGDFNDYFLSSIQSDMGTVRMINPAPYFWQTTDSTQMIEIWKGVANPYKDDRTSSYVNLAWPFSDPFYKNLTGAKNTTSGILTNQEYFVDKVEKGSGLGQFVAVNSASKGPLVQKMCFASPTESIHYRFAHRAINSDGESVRFGLYNDSILTNPSATPVFELTGNSVKDSSSYWFNNEPDWASANDPTTYANSYPYVAKKSNWIYHPKRQEGSYNQAPYTQPSVYRVHSKIFTGVAGVYNVGFQAVDPAKPGGFVDSIFVALKPIVDLGPVNKIQQTGTGTLALPIRINGAIPTNLQGNAEGIQLFIKDTGTIPDTLDWKPKLLGIPRFGSPDGGDIQPVVAVSWKAESKGWLVTITGNARKNNQTGYKGLFDGSDTDQYIYLPINMKEYGDWNISFELDDPGKNQSSSSTKWIKGTPATNPVCAGTTTTKVEFIINKSMEQWYSDVSNIYTTPNITPETLSLSTHYNLQKGIGDVRATKIYQLNGAVGAKSQRVWSAAERLDKKDWRTRSIYTTNATLFEKNTEPSILLDYKTLRTNNSNLFYTMYGKIVQGDSIADTAALSSSTELLDYIKGDRSNEGSKFYSRASLLGEVHSNVVVYKDLVYAQTGEGLLHAFDVKTGEEKWAFLPKFNLKFMNKYQRLPFGLPPEGKDKYLFEDDDISPLSVGKLTLVRVGKEMVLLATSGGMLRSEITQTRFPLFYTLTIEDNNGNVADKPIPRWSHIGECGNINNTRTAPQCGQGTLIENWKTGYLSSGEAVAFIPSSLVYSGKSRPALNYGKVGPIYRQPIDSDAHGLNVFNVDTGNSTTIYSKRDQSGLNQTQAFSGGSVSDSAELVRLFERFAESSFTDVDFIYEDNPIVLQITPNIDNPYNQKAIKEIYVSDSVGYIWRLGISGKSFADLSKPLQNGQKLSAVRGRTPYLYFDSDLNFEISYKGDKPIYKIKVSENEIERGSISGAEKGRMILFGTASSKTLRTKPEPFIANGNNIIAGYFDSTVQGFVTTESDLTSVKRLANSDSPKQVLTDIKDKVDYTTKRGWKIELKDPVSGVDKKEQVLTAPYLLGNSTALFFTAVPIESEFGLIDVPYGYFMSVNTMTGQIKTDVNDAATPPSYIDGVFAAPSIIKNDKTGKTHFNIKYASWEPESESKVGAVPVAVIDPDPCNKATEICSKTKKLSRLSVRELLAD